ncbi:hypothetical protein [Aeromonas enteropelogenes]|uniref:hypothetical protein n=1 Tax=Aeromonas enteropelogenes TaxID=29489 RepID=UPI003BA1BD87
MNYIDTFCLNMPLHVIPDTSSFNDTLNIISNISTTSGLVVAVATGIIAYFSYRNNLIEIRKSNAYGLYQTYLNLCLCHPEYSRGYERTTHIKDDAYIKYSWFVSNMLFTFEQVLNISKDDKKWVDTITHQLTIHKKHLFYSRTVRDREWDKPLQDILDKIISP